MVECVSDFELFDLEMGIFTNCFALGLLLSISLALRKRNGFEHGQNCSKVEIV